MPLISISVDSIAGAIEQAVVSKVARFLKWYSHQRATFADERQPLEGIKAARGRYLCIIMTIRMRLDILAIRMTL